MGLFSMVKRRIAQTLFRITQSRYYRLHSEKEMERIGRSQFGSLGVNAKLPAELWLVNPSQVFIGKNFSALFNLRIEAYTSYRSQKFMPRIEIGDNVIMNSDVHIGCINKISIGNNVLFASRIYISDHTHGEISEEALLTAPKDRPLLSKGPVVIEDNVWIGTGVTIMPGVTIGMNSIIGANAVVTASIPANSVAAGVPAKIIRQLK